MMFQGSIFRFQETLLWGAKKVNMWFYSQSMHSCGDPGKGLLSGKRNRGNGCCIRHLQMCPYDRIHHSMDGLDRGYGNVCKSIEYGKGMQGEDDSRTKLHHSWSPTLCINTHRSGRCASIAAACPNSYRSYFQHQFGTSKMTRAVEHVAHPQTLRILWGMAKASWRSVHYTWCTNRYLVTWLHVEIQRWSLASRGIWCQDMLVQIWPFRFSSCTHTPALPGWLSVAGIFP